MCGGGGGGGEEGTNSLLTSTCNEQIANILPTVSRQSADSQSTCKRLCANSVGQQSAICWPTVS